MEPDDKGVPREEADMGEVPKGEAPKGEVTEEEPPKKTFKLNKNHVQGFVAGVLITAIIALGLWAGFGNSDFFSGTVDGATLKTWLVSDIATARNRSDKAGLLALTKLQASMNDAERAKGSSLSAEEARDFLNREISKRRESINLYTETGRTDLAQEQQNEIAIIQSYIDRLAEPAAPAGPATTTYLMFAKDTAAGASASEIKLVGFNRDIEDYTQMPSPTLQAANGAPLYYLSTDSKSTAPNGDATVSGDIKYFASPGFPQANMAGEIRLIKDLDEAAHREFLACGGGGVSLRAAQALFSLLGTSFGGDGTTHFMVPNLPNSPVPGAKYYILSNGEYPRRK